MLKRGHSQADCVFKQKKELIMKKTLIINGLGILLSSYAWATPYTPGLITRKLASRPLVIGASVEIQALAGTRASCSAVILEKMNFYEESAKFTARASCRNLQDPESSAVELRIEGEMNHPDGDAIIRKLEINLLG